MNTVDANRRVILKGSTVNELRRAKQELSSQDKQSMLTPSLVKVKNVAGVDFKRGAVVGLDTPFPSDATAIEYNVNNFFSAVKPVCGIHDYTVAVTDEPLKAKETEPDSPETPYVIAITQGTVTVDVDITQEQHDYAIIKTNDVDKFESSWAGYPIVWRPTGTGVKKCKVKIGAIADVWVVGTAVTDINPDASGVIGVLGGGTETVFLRPPHDNKKIAAGKLVIARRWWEKCEWRALTMGQLFGIPSQTALIRLKDPTDFPSNRMLGDSLTKNPTDCIYSGEIVAFNSGDVCQEAFQVTEDCYAYDFRQYGPKTLVSYNELYLGVELGILDPASAGPARKLYAIIAELPNAHRIQNKGQATIGQFAAFEVDNVENTDVDRNAHNFRLTVRRPEKDYAHHGIALCSVGQDEYGWGWIDGTVPAKIQWQNPLHEYADIREDENNLVSSFEGATRIVQTSINGRSDLALVQLGILSDVMLCAEFLGFSDETNSVAQMRLPDASAVSASTECVDTTCGFVVGEKYNVLFSRTDKEWRLVNGPTPLTVSKDEENICLKSSQVGALTDETKVTHLAYARGMKMIPGGTGDQCKAIFGPDGETEVIDVVTKVGCSNDRIFYEVTPLIFECGIYKGSLIKNTILTDCCVNDCSPCPNCDPDCEEFYEVILGDVFTDPLLECMNSGVSSFNLTRQDGTCIYERGATPTGCPVGDCLPCQTEDDDPVSRDSQGNPCFICDGGQTCPPTCKEGIIEFIAMLRCVNGIWELEVSGGTTNKCPFVSWIITASRAADQSCPEGDFSGTLTIVTTCENGLPRISRVPVTATIVAASEG